VGADAAKILGTLSRFTASMVAVVAALDGFVAYPTLKDVVKRLLKELLRTTEFGEDVLSSQVGDRVNAWRSASYIRGLNLPVQTLRFEMTATKKVLDGYMPAGDAPEMAQFLFWLLAGDTDVFTTPSSDVAGVAAALSLLGFDMLSVEGWGTSGRDTGCRLVYVPEMMASSRLPKELPQGWAQLWRRQSTIVPLGQPEESFSTYPISAATANAARHAWLQGKRAAQGVKLCLDVPEYFPGWNDLTYKIVDLGSPPERTDPAIFALAKDRGFCINQELCERLANALERISPDILTWLHDQTGSRTMRGKNIGDPELTDQKRIDAFTVLQAFCFGYYYAVLLELVDTSTLAMPVVEGAWGFRSAETLDDIRNLMILAKPTRTNVLSVLAALLFSYSIDVIPDIGQGLHCLGVVQKRALLVNSLIGASDTLESVGKFVLLDVDVGGIPCNSAGIVRPGEAEFLDSDFADLKSLIPGPVIPQAPDIDFTKHIEPDWDLDPERMLLVMRYKGRRVLALNPSMADMSICLAYVMPVETPAPKQIVPRGLPYTVRDFMAGKTLHSPLEDIKVVVQSRGMPGVRYAATGSIQSSQVHRPSRSRETPRAWHIALVSNCVVMAATRVSTTVVA
jgi:hypothetical protein